MADTMDVDSKISAEGRVVVPAAIRAALGVHPGDRVRFTLHEGQVRLVSAQSLLNAVWANNHGGDAGDSVRDVRHARHADRGRSSAKWDRVETRQSADARTEEEREADLLAALGLPR